MIIVEYPVALVLKLWHVLFTKVFGIAPSTAWIVAVIFLVLTVRSLLAPLTLRQIRPPVTSPICARSCTS